MVVAIPHGSELDEEGRVCIADGHVEQEMLNLLVDRLKPSFFHSPSTRSHCLRCHWYALRFDGKRRLLVRF